MMKYVLLGLMSLFLGDLVAQKIVVKEEASGNVVAQAQIDIMGKRVQSQFTDNKGTVYLVGAERGDSLIVSHVSYTKLSVSYDDVLQNNNTIFLEATTLNIAPINVIGAREKAITSPQQVQQIDRKELALYNPENSASLLEKTGQVAVQRSQLGGGSPIIRGFEANRVLLVIDGVRLNNAIYRSGHLQNAITIDPNILESTEVIFGTSSLIYGSDALGGVVHFHSIDPDYSTEPTFKANVSLRYASAAEENGLNTHFEYSGKKMTSLTSMSYSDFGDLRMGANRSLHDDDDWGRVYEYVERQNGLDVVRENSNSSIQKRSGYHQYDFLQKFKFKLNEDWNLKLNGQFSTSSDVPRFDQLTAYRDGELRFAEWYYGPQDRLLTALTLEGNSHKKAYDKINVTLAYQNIDEDRIRRSLNSDIRTHNFEDVDVYSLNTDLTKELEGDRHLYYGVEVIQNEVSSASVLDNIVTGESERVATRYPNGGSQLFSAAGYVSYLNPFKEKWQYNAGLRYSLISARSEFEAVSDYTLPFEEIELDNAALTGSLGLKYEPNDHDEVRILASTGFRAPNVDDYGKVFERNGFVVVPDDRIEPEYVINGEIGFSKGLIDNKLKTDLSLYYTHILDAIVQRDFQLNGLDSMLIEGDMARIQSNQNASEANIYGAGFTFGYNFLPEWHFNGAINYTYGQDLDSDVPMAHIPPVFGKGELAYKKKNWSAAFYMYYHGTKTADRIAPGRTDNPSQGLNGEFPSWHTFNTRITYDITPKVTAQVALENMADYHYRTFASGISAPGRNLILSIRTNL